MKLIDDIKMWMLSPTDAAVYCYIENSDTNLPYGMLHNMETTAYDPVTKAILRGAMLRHNRRIRGIEMMQRLVNNGKSVQELVEENMKVEADREYGLSDVVSGSNMKLPGQMMKFKSIESVNKPATYFGTGMTEEGRYGL